MPILTRVGRRSPGHIAMRAGMYGLLGLGAVCIIYPMLIVLGQTLSDQFDLRDNAIVPYYLRDRNELALKHIYAMARRPDLAAARHHRNLWKNQAAMRDDHDFYRTRPAAYAAMGLNLDAWQAVLADFNAFKAAQPPSEFTAKIFRVEDYLRPFLFERFEGKARELREAIERGQPHPEWLVRTFPDEDYRDAIIENDTRLGVAVMNHELRSDYRNFYGLEIAREGNQLAPHWRPGDQPKDRLWAIFKESLPPEQRLIFPADAYWHLFLKLKYRNIAEVNRAWGTKYDGIPELRFPLTPPAEPAIRADWSDFVVHRWPRRLLGVPERYATVWRDHVRRQLLKKHEDEPDPDAKALADAGRLTGRPLANWDELPFSASLPEDETLARYWSEFTTSGAVPAEAMVLDAPETRFRAFLRAKYGDDRADEAAADVGRVQTGDEDHDERPNRGQDAAQRDQRLLPETVGQPAAGQGG
jgi:hypothetical protein